MELYNEGLTDLLAGFNQRASATKHVEVSIVEVSVIHNSDDAPVASYAIVSSVASRHSTRRYIRICAPCSSHPSQRA